MILLRQLFLTCFWLFTAQVSACSCIGGPASFSLPDYDRSYDVIEVSFFAIEEIGDGPKDYRLARLRYDSLLQVYRERGKIGPPPPPPPPPRHEVLVGGVVADSFKGRMKRDTTWFVSDRSGASCGWTPRFGMRYLIYVGKPRDFDGRKMSRLGLCQRRFALRDQSSRAYHQERKMLRVLRRKKNGSLARRQFLRVKGEKVRFAPVRGQFRRGERHGVWVVNQPIEPWQDSMLVETPAFSITYDLGKIEKVTLLAEGNRPRFLNYPRYRRWANDYKIAAVKEED